jgi:hypothetical protein
MINPKYLGRVLDDSCDAPVHVKNRFYFFLLIFVVVVVVKRSCFVCILRSFFSPK